MKGFLLGLLVAALVASGYFFWKARHLTEKAPVAKVTADAGPTGKRVKKKRTRGARRLARTAETGMAGSQPSEIPGGESLPEPEPEPEPIRLSAADLKTVSQGDDLSRPDVIRLDMSDDVEVRELGQDDIDARFRASEGAILDCISRARPDAETYVPGRVNVKFRIQRPGTVRGVRVDGPAILQKGGLYGCIKGVVGRIKFPSSGSSQIVSYPFTLS